MLLAEYRRSRHRCASCGCASVADKLPVALGHTRPSFVHHFRKVDLGCTQYTASLCPMRFADVENRFISKRDMTWCGVRSPSTSRINRTELTLRWQPGCMRCAIAHTIDIRCTGYITCTENGKGCTLPAVALPLAVSTLRGRQLSPR